MVKEAKRATGSGPGKPDLETLSVGKPKKDLKGWDFQHPRSRNAPAALSTEGSLVFLHNIILFKFM